MWKPCQCDGVAIANAAAANWELGLKTGNIGTLATLPALSTVNTSKTGRFLALLYQSPSLPKLPPHFAKCGGNQKNDTLPYFLLLHLNAHEELFRRRVFRCRLDLHLAAFGLAEFDIDILCLEFALIQRSRPSTPNTFSRFAIDVFSYATYENYDNALQTRLSACHK